MHAVLQQHMAALRPGGVLNRRGRLKLPATSGLVDGGVGLAGCGERKRVCLGHQGSRVIQGKTAVAPVGDGGGQWEGAQAGAARRVKDVHTTTAEERSSWENRSGSVQQTDGTAGAPQWRGVRLGQKNREEGAYQCTVRAVRAGAGRQQRQQQRRRVQGAASVQWGACLVGRRDGADGRTKHTPPRSTTWRQRRARGASETEHSLL